MLSVNVKPLPVHHHLSSSPILSLSSITLQSIRLIYPEITVSVESSFSSISLTNFFICLTLFTQFVISFVPQCRVILSGLWRSSGFIKSVMSTVVAPGCGLPKAVVFFSSKPPTTKIFFFSSFFDFTWLCLLSSILYSLSSSRSFLWLDLRSSFSNICLL